jgi:hypothetical protein
MTKTAFKYYLITNYKYYFKMISKLDDLEIIYNKNNTIISSRKNYLKLTISNIEFNNIIKQYRKQKYKKLWSKI